YPPDPASRGPVFKGSNQSTDMQTSSLIPESNRLIGILWSVVLISLITSCQSTTGKLGDQTINDAGISAAVQAKLMSDRVSHFFHVAVSTEEGIVSLSGTVEAKNQRAGADYLARQIEGVLKVNNNLQIQNRPAADKPFQPNML